MKGQKNNKNYGSAKKLLPETESRREFLSVKKCLGIEIGLRIFIQ